MAVAVEEAESGDSTDNSSLGVDFDFRDLLMAEEGDLTNAEDNDCLSVLVIG